MAILTECGGEISSVEKSVNNGGNTIPKENGLTNFISHSLNTPIFGCNIDVVDDVCAQYFSFLECLVQCDLSDFTGTSTEINN